MDEWWDLVDAAGVPTGGTFRRGDAGWPGGAFHLVVTVCVYRADGTVLLTQRAPTKEFAFGWEFPGGSAFAGETGPAAACRELLEETNVTVEPEALRRVGRFTEETALVDLFVVQEPSGSAVQADPAEVMDWRWVSLSEVSTLRTSGVMAAPWGPRLDALWPAATATILAADDSRERTSPPHESW
ncbi:NUDIX hydrolase [Curtobacterium flaccumfaciens pv. flaccumfaciens]|uniref:NUDIX hydrolase n=1 Tax=Curtobacterium flaccumfaciens pv. flaccumfaciens TaxID=138532 RepID=A0A9Q2W1V8_9MICO|nr:NUDIX hydrolase [Curtobacterium flaccumfaciens]MBT1540755.1 NUDIX hydrolase [Curtobacterium flaccumfaciens pv. flaccumfaciens]